MMEALQQEDTPMIKRPSFPVADAQASPGRRFDHRLTTVAVALAIILAAAMLVRYTGPIPDTESDPDTYVVGP
jgi:hypothetical protein